MWQNCLSPQKLSLPALWFQAYPRFGMPLWRMSAVWSCGPGSPRLSLSPLRIVAHGNAWVPSSFRVCICEAARRPAAIVAKYSDKLRSVRLFGVTPHSLSLPHLRPHASQEHCVPVSRCSAPTYIGCVRVPSMRHFGICAHTLPLHKVRADTFQDFGVRARPAVEFCL